MASDLQQYINQTFEVAPDTAQRLETAFVDDFLPKGEYFTKMGSYHNRLSFVHTGYLRVYAERNGRDITQWITSPGEFITDLSALIFRQPARWHIQALTDCQLFSMPPDRYAQMEDHIPNWPQIEKAFIAKCFLLLEDRVFSFLSMPAEDRFRELMGMTFKPKVLAFRQKEEFRWRGQFLFPGLFDGEHYVRLSAKADGTTRLEHGEHFSGLLVPLFKRRMLADTEKNFKAFNEALKQESEKPVPTGA